VSHDAGNLLRATSLSLERMALHPALGDDVSPLLEQARGQLREAQGFLKVVGHAPDIPQPFDAVACLRLVIALHGDRQRIVVDDVVPGFVVQGQPRALARILSNLLTNGLEHAERVHVAAEDGVLRVSNALQGPAPDDSIYERGRSSKGTGRGLGLHWSRRLAGELGAELHHESLQRDGGSWIQFVLDFSGPPERPRG
jgi:signal transduction histidine kinase